MRALWDQYEHLFNKETMTFGALQKVVDETTRDWSRCIIDVSLKKRQGIEYAELFWWRPNSSEIEENQKELVEGWY